MIVIVIVVVLSSAQVLAAAQFGVHNSKRDSFGQSLAIDPWGRIVGECADPQVEGLAIADLDLGAVDTVRTAMPIENVSQNQSSKQTRILGRPVLCPFWFVCFCVCVCVCVFRPSSLDQHRRLGIYGSGGASTASAD